MKQPVLIRMSRGKGIVSRIICWFTDSHWSHVDFVLADGRLLGARSHKDGAANPGVQIRPSNYLQNAEVDHLFLEVVGADYDIWEPIALSQEGKPYDTWGLLANFALNRNWREDDSWWCSEFVNYIADTAKQSILNPTVPSNQISPRDLTLSLLVRPWDGQ